MEVELPGHRWTLKKVVNLVEKRTGIQISRSKARTMLQRAGLSWKKCKKLLTKADPDKRAAYAAQLEGLFTAMCQGKVRLIYIDEVHLHQDMDLGYSWSTRGEADWVPSHSPGLSAKLNWYGAYDFTDGQCFLWENGRCNSDNTIGFLQALSQWLEQSESALPVCIIMDGAPWHRSHRVYSAADDLGIELVRLPAYSPDLNPIEGLWKWMREDITQRHCHSSLAALANACHKFIDRINSDPNRLIQRLWPKFDLDPDYEKRLVSN